MPFDMPFIHYVRISHKWDTVHIWLQLTWKCNSCVFTLTYTKAAVSLRIIAMVIAVFFHCYKHFSWWRVTENDYDFHFWGSFFHAILTQANTSGFSALVSSKQHQGVTLFHTVSATFPLNCLSRECIELEISGSQLVGHELKMNNT